MSEPDRARGSFSEKEMTQIVALAARLQERERAASPAPEAARGFTLAELQQVAAEVGIGPRHIAAAARALAEGRTAERSGLWGAPANWEIEQVVAGEASATEWEEMVAEIRRQLGRAGTPGTLGRSFEWQAGNTDPSVTVSPRDGETRIRVALRPRELLVGAYFVGGLYSLMGSAIAAGALHLPQAAELAISAGILGGGVGFVRQMLSLWFRRKSRRMRELLERLSELATARHADTSTATTSTRRLSTVADGDLVAEPTASVHVRQGA